MNIEVLIAGPLPGLDPNECEREPIHIPGAIQPHGALLAVLAESGTVTHASANLAAILGYSPEAVMGQSIEFAIGKAAWHAMQTSEPGEKIVLGAPSWKIGPDARDISLNAYWTGPHIGIDLEPANPWQAHNVPRNSTQIPTQTPLLMAVQTILETFERATTKLELCQSAMRGLQALTGYDRVMVYRFGKQGQGEVVAEAIAPHLDPYLGNNYPTTDIPPQARRLFLAKRVSSVADSSYQPVPLFAREGSDHGMPLDLTQSALRSVSPIHREYMRNMGTAASLSIGLASGSELWGFIICHHGTPRVAGPDLRTAVDMIGRVVSALLGSLDEAEMFAHRNARSDTMRSLIERLAGPQLPAAALAAAEVELLHLVGAAGAVIHIGDDKLRIGKTPPAAASERAMLVMQSQVDTSALLAVDNLGLAHPDLADCIDAGSGVLLLPISGNGDDFILWFRPEHSRIVTWAGDPGQHATRDTLTGRLSPRVSFAAWQQTTQGRSRPWTKADLALAGELGNAVGQELARRAKAELDLMRHYQDLSDSLELQVNQRTEALEAEISERFKVEAALQQGLRVVSEMREGGLILRRSHDALEAQVVKSTRDLEYMAFHDDLTKLCNRSYFLDRLTIALIRAKRDVGFNCAVLFMDLDHFKLVNDSLGHPAGDLLLIEVARRLQTCTRFQDTLGRMGGDEFALLVEGFDDLAAVEAIARRINDVLRQPVWLGKQEIVTSCSIGVIVPSARDQSPEDLLRDADIAMYQAKRQGAGGYAVFASSMYDAAVDALDLRVDLQNAVAHGEFILHYQPIYIASTLKIAGFEALVRWRHPKRGLVAPDFFVRVAEETGLIKEIGAWVLREACMQMHLWREQFPGLNLAVNVNTSGEELKGGDFHKDVGHVLAVTGLDPHALHIEITESIFLKYPSVVGALLRSLRPLGVKFALDDFGNGYSSLSYLDRYEIDTIKIDHSFIAMMIPRPRTMAIVEAIIKLGHALSLSIVAEGVEEDAQIEVLRAMGCDFVQGYLFNKPMSVDAVTEMLVRQG